MRRPTSPTPEGRGGAGRARCWGAGADHRASLGPVPGLCVGRAAGGEDGEAGGPGHVQRRSMWTGALFPVRACIYSCAVGLWKRLLSCQIVNYLGSS